MLWLFNDHYLRNRLSPIDREEVGPGGGKQWKAVEFILAGYDN